MESKFINSSLMKKLYLLLLCISMSFSGFAQHVSKTMQHGGLSRQYLEYVPSIYDGSAAVPLLICLHGLGDNMNNFKTIQMDAIADTANFIVLTPQAQSSFLGTAWNSGAGASGMQLNENVDDAGFIIALIDSTAAIYNIDPRRVYLTGFSMGAFMCHRMACEYGDRITAIASVSGTIGSAIQCSPIRPVPVVHFHGTADESVAYTGNQYGLDVDSLLNYWVTINNCDQTPIITELPDIADDGLTVEHLQYENGVSGSTVEHYKVIGGTHTWIYRPVNDIDYTTLIWDFLSKQSLVGLNVENTEEFSLDIYPNPNSGIININLPEKGYEISIYSIDGRLIFNELAQNNYFLADISKYSKGIYIVHAKCKQTGSFISAKISKD